MTDTIGFTADTFAYFDGAREHTTDRAWFEAHRELYAEAVEVPFTHLVCTLGEQLSPLLPGIVFSPRKITKPMLRKGKEADGPLLRENATAYFAETATSMFEMNPGIYLSIGAEPDDNVFGCGLYMPSSRQMGQLRPRFQTAAGELDTLLREASVQGHWKGLMGERYQRFPKGFDETAPGAGYLWYKQFYLGKHASRKEMMRAGFIEQTVGAFVAAAPFLSWTRNAVGVYRKPKRSEFAEA